MPGYIMHLAEAGMVFEILEERGYYLSPEWKNRFRLGCLLPDTKEKREKVTSHFWNPESLDRQAIAPDMDLFYLGYEEKMRGPLMLGYRTHLMLDALYVNVFWDQVLEFQGSDGSRKSLAKDIAQVLLKKTGEVIPSSEFFTRSYYYGDYSRMNEPLRKKYKITLPEYEEELDCPVKEVDPRKLKMVLKQLGELMQKGPESAKEELRVFDMEAIERFLRDCALEAADFIGRYVYMIALDLDGTLLSDDKQLSRHSRQTLERCIAQGHQVVIASGRPCSALPDPVLEIEGISYAIASNGVRIYDLRKNLCILHTPLASEAVEKVLELADQKGAAIEIMLDGQAYSFEDFVRNPGKYGVDSYGIPYIQATRKPVDDIFGFALEHRAALDAIDIMTADLAFREELMQALKEIPGLYVTSSVPRLIEISAEGAGKGNALRYMAERMEIRPSEILAFGNEKNDLDMMLYAGCGVAVANSPEHVLQLADYIAGTNNEDGVAAFLEQFLDGKFQKKRKMESQPGIKYESESGIQ